MRCIKTRLLSGLKQFVGRFVCRGVLLFASFYSQIWIRHSVKVLRRRNSAKIRVAFMVVFDSVFPLERLFRLMLQDPSFDPVIVVIPDIARGREHMEMVFSHTFRALKAKYGRYVYSSRSGDEFEDYCGKFDLYTTMNPYPRMTHKYYRISYLARHGCLVFAVRYFYDSGNIYSDIFNRLPELSFLWRFYAQSPKDQSEIARRQRVLSFFKRIRAIGTPKMDDYVAFQVKDASRKCIIIAPHHSIEPIGPNGFSIGNFDRYCDFILSLPSRYPQIDWIVRPHPLTLRTMVNTNRWTQADADTFVERMSSFSNVEYQDGGEYWSAFAKADALIQDCTSFLPEWYYTGKPQCFVLRDQKAEKTQFLKSGQELLSHVYKAFNQDDILHFIDTVVIDGDDKMESERREYAKTLMYNYPYASEALLNDIKVSIRRIDD